KLPKPTGASTLLGISAFSWLPSRPADRHPVQLDRGHTHAHRHALAVLSASTDAFVELQVVADHRYVLQCLRAVADKSCIAHRRGHFAIFNEVRLGCREDELSVRDIDLSAAEVHGVKPAFHAA